MQDGIQGLINLDFVTFLAIAVDKLDVTDEENVKAVVLKYTTQSDPAQNVNVLFNCAG